MELAVKRGADVFVRDKRGRRVLEHEKGGDERIKMFLKQFNNQDNLVQSKSDGRPPDLKGFLSKWVNYRSGWRTRWFVLENGVLSYYRNREDEAVACRGSISMASAKLHPSNDGSRFEVHSLASSSVPKIIVKSAHRAEIARWVQTLRLNIEYFSKEPEPGTKAVDGLERKPSSASSRMGSRSRSHASEAASSTLSALPPTNDFLDPTLKRTATGLSGLSLAPPAGDGLKSRGSPSTSLRNDQTTAFEQGDDTLSIFEAAENASLIGGDDAASMSAGVPHESSFSLGVLNIKAQIELTQQLVDSIVTSPQPAGAHSSTAMQRTPSRQAAVKEALRSSLATLALQITQQGVMSQDREKYFLSRIQRETEARKLWEENMLTVAQQQAEMDRQLTEAAKDNEKKRRALRQARGVLAGLGNSLPGSPGVDAPRDSISSVHGILETAPTTPGPLVTAGMMSPPLTGDHATDVREAQDALIAAGADSESEDDDDEFFDAIEHNAIPNLRLYDSIANPERPGTPSTPRESTATARDPSTATSSATQGQEVATGATIEQYLSRQSLEPYQHVRHKLPIDDDKRPSVSLWSILKSSVGKDLTKISFPVSFNECTSMLQRMAEDMEYDACLTVAASEEDALKRIAFVGAFAMSNYSSTIGRVAKPFNPLLNQSFEYAIPNRYRYISEQVSHHPVSTSTSSKDSSTNISPSPHATPKLLPGSTTVKSMPRISFRDARSRSDPQVWRTLS